MRGYAAASLLAVATIAAPATAATVVFNGDTTGDPTFNRPLTTTSLSGVGTAVPYEVTGFTVNVAGSYQLNLDALAASPLYDTFLALYSGSFNAASPLANILAVDDDGGPASNSQITFTLNTGVNYFAVATGFDNTDFGLYALTIAGPGTATRIGSTPAVPEPASWAMMLVGFGAVGYSLRRKGCTRLVQAV